MLAFMLNLNLRKLASDFRLIATIRKVIEEQINNSVMMFKENKPEKPSLQYLREVSKLNRENRRLKLDRNFL